MRLFGSHLFAFPLFTVSLLALSAGVFLWRFPDDRSAVVTVSFFALTLMPVHASRVGPRVRRTDTDRWDSLFFVARGSARVSHRVGPSRPRGGDAAKKWDTMLLAVQTIIPVLAVLVRGNAAFVAGPILFVVLVKVWRSRGNRNELRSLRRKAAVIAMVGAVFVGSLLAVLQSHYLWDGRVTTVLWHRVVVSLGINPAWPFSNLREVYHCETGGLPEGLVPAPLTAMEVASGRSGLARTMFRPERR
jgi:hypothetical protein